MSTATWRLARSLETLRDEIRARHPGTTVWTIGDPAHATTWSDHNPNGAGVVCAIDVLGDKGLDLGWLAKRVLASNHVALKYVIFNRRIASRGGSWRSYSGDNPHATHVHVSVGIGPDGRTGGPYDNTAAWGVAPAPPPAQPTTPTEVEMTPQDLLKTEIRSDPLGGKFRVEDLLKQGLKAARLLEGGQVATGAEPVPGLIAELRDLAAVVAELRDRPVPGTVQISDEQLERVLRRVIGSVDGASPAE